MSTHNRESPLFTACHACLESQFPHTFCCVWACDGSHGRHEAVGPPSTAASALWGCTWLAVASG